MELYLRHQRSNHANCRPAWQAHGSGELARDCCSRRSSPAAVVELGRWRANVRASVFSVLSPLPHREEREKTAEGGEARSNERKTMMNSTPFLRFGLMLLLSASALPASA